MPVGREPGPWGVLKWEEYLFFIYTVLFCLKIFTMSIYITPSIKKKITSYKKEVLKKCKTIYGPSDHNGDLDKSCLSGISRECPGRYRQRVRGRWEKDDRVHKELKKFLCKREKRGRVGAEVKQWSREGIVSFFF